MKNNATDIVVVLDRSGSMSAIKSDIEGGYKSFIDDQRKQDGVATISLYQFDDQFETVYEGQDIKTVSDLHLVPRNMTALHDAICKTINMTGERLSKMPEADRPGKVVFVIITDGLENSSQEFTGADVANMVKHQTEKYNWQFQYIGANQDAVATGSTLGFTPQNSITYIASSAGTTNVFRSMSDKMSKYRQTGNTSELTFDAKDRQEATAN